MKTRVLALDLGTGGCKGAVYDTAGDLVAEVGETYPISRPAPLWAEQDPGLWWAATTAVCRRLTGMVPADTIAAVGLSGQVPTMVLVDAAGHALAPAITWQDRRAQQEAEWLQERLGPEQLQHWLGLALPVDAAYPPARLLWWRRHQPDVIARAHRVLMARDFLLLQLTGEFCSDAWSAKGLVHLLTGEASAEYYAALGLPASLAPRILPPSSVAGTVRGIAADATGLRQGTPVVVGWSDALCGMTGTGALGMSGVAFDLAGTSDIVGYTGAAPAPGLLHVPSSIADGISVLYGPTQSSGDSLLWFTEWTGTADVDATVAAAETAPPGADGLIFLPYLQGERAPIWDAMARGAFVGLQRQHSRGHGARAVMEGVAMSVRHVLDACGAPCGPHRTLRATGGGTRSDLWNRIRADVTGMSLAVTEHTNATTLGAAMLAAVGVGLYDNLQDATAMVRVRATYDPDAERVALYDALYGRYRALYPALRPMFGHPDVDDTDHEDRPRASVARGAPPALQHREQQGKGRHR